MKPIKKQITLAALAAVLGTTAFADDQIFSGQVGLSTTGKSNYLNFGGPNFKAKIQGITFGLSLYPSVRFDRQGSTHHFNPQLGFGPFIEWNRIVFMVPMYSLKETGDSQVNLKASFGLGYRF